MRFLLAVLLGGAAVVTLTDLVACSQDAASSPGAADGAPVSGLDAKTAPGLPDANGSYVGSIDNGHDCGLSRPTVSPTFTPPNPLHRGLCTGSQVEALMECFLGPGGSTSSACTSLVTTPQLTACEDCLVTSYAARKAGALIDNGSTATFDRPGCIANLVAGDAGVACAAAVAALDQCVSGACEDTMPCPDVGPDASSCPAAARATVCSDYAAAAACADALEADGGAAAPCALGGPQQRIADGVRYGMLFCGAPAPVDAGDQ